MEDLRVRLKDMREVISDERFKDIILHAITTDYDYVRQTSFRERDFGLKKIKSIIRNMFMTVCLALRPSASRGGEWPCTRLVATAAFSASTASNAGTVAVTALNLFGPSPSSNSNSTSRNTGRNQEASRARSGALSTRRRTTAIQSAST